MTRDGGVLFYFNDGLEQIIHSTFWEDEEGDYCWTDVGGFHKTKTSPQIQLRQEAKSNWDRAYEIGWKGPIVIREQYDTHIPGGEFDDFYVLNDSPDHFHLGGSLGDPSINYKYYLVPFVTVHPVDSRYDRSPVFLELERVAPWAKLRSRLKLFQIVNFWMSLTVHLYAPGGAGRERDKEAFERDI